MVELSSIMKKEIKPMKKKQTKNVGHPPNKCFGGIIANKKRQGIVQRWTMASQQVTSSTCSYSSMTGPSMIDYLNCPNQVGR
jgi:hypothetical protein